MTFPVLGAQGFSTHDVTAENVVLAGSRFVHPSIDLYIELILVYVSSIMPFFPIRVQDSLRYGIFKFLHKLDSLQVLTQMKLNAIEQGKPAKKDQKKTQERITLGQGLQTVQRRQNHQV